MRLCVRQKDPQKNAKLTHKRMGFYVRQNGSLTPHVFAHIGQIQLITHHHSGMLPSMLTCCSYLGGKRNRNDYTGELTSCHVFRERFRLNLCIGLVLSLRYKLPVAAASLLDGCFQWLENGQVLLYTAWLMKRHFCVVGHREDVLLLQFEKLARLLLRLIGTLLCPAHVVHMCDQTNWVNACNVQCEKHSIDAEGLTRVGSSIAVVHVQMIDVKPLYQCESVCRLK